MNKELNYIKKTAEVLSDKKVCNQLGTLYANSKANAKLFITEGVVKNVYANLAYNKANLCNYAKKVYTCEIEASNNKEYYENAVEFIDQALVNDISAKELYEAAVVINKGAQDKLNIVYDEEMALEM